ncbi:acyl-CoA thioesterase [Corynebacterium otitidis]|uniref:YbgC/YbaW family acyl-CoA thioester hydrolase n=1 Tax=Corynebacterium otitidis ATCC 51513 TaxID=883169 RepID=K0YG80_9CORY|nr:thioesterase family protein [Corynebacterium otitidis]EJZ82547.1 YbgC/YbaW family acyl-CoA thioester hydrolase [Corynebacterium otitidis ATCC 51513]
MAHEDTPIPQGEGEPTHVKDGVHHAKVQLRWNDFDRYGHLNNAQYLELSQEARTNFAVRVLGRADGNFPPMFVRHVELDYLAPVEPDDNQYIMVRTWVSRIGNTSFTTKQEIVTTDGTVACEVETVFVVVDLESGRPVPLQDDHKAALNLISAGQEL